MSDAAVDLETAERLAADAVVAVMTERDVLVATGPDAASYLQGQISQNAEGLAVGATTWTLLLQPQGKVDAWLRMHRVAPDRFTLDVDAGHGSGALDRLERFKLRVDVSFELQTTPTIAFRGPGSSDAADALVASREGAVALDASFAGVDGMDVLAIDGAPISFDSVDDSVPRGPAELLDVVRIRQGMPAMGQELDESTIPAAAGIVDRSVDFTKGCYVGQELVARIDSRGNNTPTRLYGLRFAGGTPSAGAALQLDGADVGTITSVAVSPTVGAVGLGYLKRSVEVPATLSVAGDDGVTAAADALPSDVD